MKAAEEVIDTLAVFDETQPPISVGQNPIRHTLQTVWLHFKEVRLEVLCPIRITALLLTIVR